MSSTLGWTLPCPARLARLRPDLRCTVRALRKTERRFRRPVAFRPDPTPARRLFGAPAENRHGRPACCHSRPFRRPCRRAAAGRRAGNHHRVRRRLVEERARRRQRRLHQSDRHQGCRELRGEFRAGQADRSRRARRCVHLGRSALDGLRRRQKADQDGHPRQSARQPAGADRAEGFQARSTSPSARASTSPSSPATAASRSPT